MAHDATGTGKQGSQGTANDAEGGKGGMGSMGDGHVSDAGRGNQGWKDDDDNGTSGKEPLSGYAFSILVCPSPTRHATFLSTAIHLFFGAKRKINNPSTIINVGFPPDHGCPCDLQSFVLATGSIGILNIYYQLI